MIFDNIKVTEDLLKWKSTNNERILTRIVKNSQHLVEAIVSSYDPYYREDMIQNAFVKLLGAINKYDPERGTTLHTYFTTVIHNTCRTTMKLESKHYNIFNIDDVERESEDNDADVADISFVIEYCRTRFPDIDINLVDYAVITFVNHISLYGLKKSRDACRKLIDETNIDYKTLDLLYKIVIILLRYNHIEDVLFEEEGENMEMSVIPEMRYIFGEQTTDLMQVLFAGIQLKL